MSDGPRRPFRFAPSRAVITGACEILGLAVLSFGLFMLLPWLGVCAAGLSLLAVGYIVGVRMRAVLRVLLSLGLVAASSLALTQPAQADAYIIICNSVRFVHGY